jgi:hypothetical protein
MAGLKFAPVRLLASESPDRMATTISSRASF